MFLYMLMIDFQWYVFPHYLHVSLLCFINLTGFFFRVCLFSCVFAFVYGCLKGVCVFVVSIPCVCMCVLFFLYIFACASVFFIRVYECASRNCKQTNKQAKFITLKQQQQ